MPSSYFAVDDTSTAVGRPLFPFVAPLISRREKNSFVHPFGLSMSIKTVGLILLLVMFFFEKGWRNKLYALLVPVDDSWNSVYSLCLYIKSV